MARLTTLKPLITRMAPRLAPDQGETARNRYRDETQEHRGWYKTARWKALRWQALKADHFRCSKCRAEHPIFTPMCEALASAGRLDTLDPRRGIRTDRVADHIIPHRGDERLFWDAGNLQCLCKPCHDGAKQREERARGWA